MLPVLIQQSLDRIPTLLRDFNNLPVSIKIKYFSAHPCYKMRKIQFFKFKKVIAVLLNNLDIGTCAIGRRNTHTNDMWHLTEKKLAKEAGVSVQALQRVLSYLKSCKYLYYKRLKNSKCRKKCLSLSFFMHFFKHSKEFVVQHLNKYRDIYQKTQEKLQNEDKMIAATREKHAKPRLNIKKDPSKLKKIAKITELMQLFN